MSEPTYACVCHTSPHVRACVLYNERKMKEYQSKPASTYDATFYAFHQLSKLVELFMAPAGQLNAAQSDAIHAYSKKMAKELTSGLYEYTERT